MKRKKPLLLNYSSLTNKNTTTISGQITRSALNNISFQLFNTRKTAATLIKLYFSSPLKNQDIILSFDKEKYAATTDQFGEFNLLITGDHLHKKLQSITTATHDEVIINKNLYPLNNQDFNSDHIVISDIDDTLIQSFIRKKMKKVWTLLFTKVEKRKTIEDTKTLITSLEKSGAKIVYLSNSEQNLSPLIHSFLNYNNFPKGGLFLKHLRSFRDLLFSKKTPHGDTHKINALKKIIQLFNEKQFTLVGDNTQNDLEIYLSISKCYPKNIKNIIIRDVFSNKQDNAKLLEEETEWLKNNDIAVYYSKTFIDILKENEPVNI